MRKVLSDGKWWWEDGVERKTGAVKLASDSQLRVRRDKGHDWDRIDEEKGKYGI